MIAEARNGAPFKLRRASFKGKGLRPELRNASWDRLCDLRISSSAVSWRLTEVNDSMSTAS